MSAETRAATARHSRTIVFIGYETTATNVSKVRRCREASRVTSIHQEKHSQRQKRKETANGLNTSSAEDDDPTGTMTRWEDRGNRMIAGPRFGPRTRLAQIKQTIRFLK